MKIDYTINEVKTPCGVTPYIRFGTGEKVLVILPGLSIGSVLDSASGIASSYSIFAKDYTVYLLDRKKEIPQGYKLSEMASDAYEAITALGLEKIDLYGVSQGGMMAQYITLDHPGFVRRLVLASTMSRNNEHADRVLGTWIEAAKNNDRRKLASSFMGALYTPAFVRRFSLFFQMQMMKIPQSELDRFLILAPAALGHSSYERLSEITCPTLVLGAENDAVSTAQASREIAEKIGCEIYLYPAPYGHAVYDEAPDFKKRIYAFLQKPDDSSADS